MPLLNYRVSRQPSGSQTYIHRIFLVKQINKGSMRNYQRVLSQKILFLSLFLMQDLSKHNLDFGCSTIFILCENQGYFISEITAQGFSQSSAIRQTCSLISVMLYCLFESYVLFHSSVSIHFSPFQCSNLPNIFSLLLQLCFPIKIFVIIDLGLSYQCQTRNLMWLCTLYG